MNSSAGKIPDSLSKLWQRLSPFLLIGIVVLVCYGPTMTFGFTGFDENGFIIEEYPAIRDIRNAGKVFHEALFPRFKTIYRPVFIDSLIVDAQFGGTAPLAYHISNILFHIIASSLLFSLFLALRLRPKRALFCALLFAVHPVVTQAVAWIPGRNDTLLGIGVFGSFLFLVRYLRQRTVLNYLLHLFFAAFAIFAKETAVVLPVMFVAFLFLVHREKQTAGGIVFAGWVAVFIVWFLGRMTGASSPALDMARIIHYVFGGIPVLIQYLGKMVFPFRLTVFPEISILHILCGSVFLLCLCWTGRSTQADKRPFMLFAFLWVLVFLFPTLIIIGDENIYYDHRAYVPLAGFIILLSEIADAALKQVSRPYWRIRSVGILLIGLFGVFSSMYSRVFADARVFWQRAYADTPDSRAACGNMALVAAQEKKFTEAQRYLQDLIKRNPRDAGIYNNLGTLYFEQKDYQRSIEAYRSAISVNPGFIMTYYNLGNVYLSLKDYGQAIRIYREGMARGAKDIDLSYNLGVAYFKSGQMIDALEQFRGVAAVAPAHTPALQKMKKICEDSLKKRGAAPQTGRFPA